MENKSSWILFVHLSFSSLRTLTNYFILKHGLSWIRYFYNKVKTTIFTLKSATWVSSSWVINYFNQGFKRFLVNRFGNYFSYKQTDIFCILEIQYLFMIFQDAFRQVQYRMIGDDSTPTFFSVNPLSGVISLRNVSLQQDTGSVYNVGHSVQHFVSVSKYMVCLTMFWSTTKHV